MEPIIKLKNVNFWYDHGKSTEMHALSDINLEIDKGEYVAFFGPSGSGKTTLLYLLSGTEVSQAGEIIINGKDISHLSQKELALYRQMGVGMIFQQFNLIPNLTVLDNVALPMTFLGVSPDKRTKEAKGLLERLDISALAKRFPYELSGGQQQRVGIARALANNAPIIVADEPIGNLDSVNAANVLDFLKELHEKDGKTIIIVTHEAWSMRDAQKVFHIKDGAIEKVEMPKAATAAGKGEYKQLAPVQPQADAAAYMLTNMLFRGYSAEETKRFNVFLSQRLTGQIDATQFLQFLNNPFRQGGGGLWKARALQISRYVEGIIQEHLTLEEVCVELEKDPKAALIHEIAEVTEWLLQGNRARLDQVQETRFKEAAGEVLRNIINLEAFKEILYLPKSRLGVGLSHRATENIYEKFKMATGSFDLDLINGAPGAK